MNSIKYTGLDVHKETVSTAAMATYSDGKFYLRIDRGNTILPSCLSFGPRRLFSAKFQVFERDIPAILGSSQLCVVAIFLYGWSSFLIAVGDTSNHLLME